ncbi:MAG: PGPGW domain-containing protein [Planctomycetaceae bacterium]|nr:PGPGW domain-containing protein [Planctomycetaceae bacterium]
MLPPRAALIFWGHARKVVVLVVGLTVVLIGVALLILPGPGWLIIFGGLALLATEFAWARWMLKQARSRFEQLKQAAISTWNHGPAATAPPRSDD